MNYITTIIFYLEITEMLNLPTETTYLQCWTSFKSIMKDMSIIRIFMRHNEKPSKLNHIC